MELVGRTAYLDWDDKVIAITVFKNGYKPKNAKFTQRNPGFNKNSEKQNVPKVVDLYDFDGEIMEMNPQDSAMQNFYGRDINTYLHDVFWTEQDQKNQEENTARTVEKAKQKDRTAVQTLLKNIEKKK